MPMPREMFFEGRARDCAVLASSASSRDERAALMALRRWYLQQLGAGRTRRAML
jgi:hypothetical protein